MGTDQMIQDLQSPAAYPEATDSVQLVQTHISWVFICDEFVYKLKKPMDFGFLDFTSLDKRKHYCEKEVDLNRRLAKDVYLGVFPVILEGDKHKIATSAGSSEPVEYAVKMRVLPTELLMKTKFNSGTLSENDIDRTAKVIADFHAIAAQSTEINQFGTLATVKFNTDENFQQTQEFIGNSIRQEQFDALKTWTDKFYEDNASLLQKRIAADRIRDCHGDLHMEHICLTDPITIFDCIEFNDRFRYSDIASDVAFLMMDLEYHGGAKFAVQLYDSYKKYSGETGSDLDLIIKYYKVYRAYVRGKVTSFQLNDPNISVDRKEAARKTAQKYFDLAYKYILD